jgi:predicted DNA-binding ribbon-helix-helix protein
VLGTIFHGMAPPLRVWGESRGNIVSFASNADSFLLMPEPASGGYFDSLETFDMRLAKPEARSLRLNGKSTCLRLERVYWDIIAQTARRKGVSVSSLLSSLDRDVQFRFGEVANFSSLVRVVSVAQIARSLPCLRR